MTLPAAPPAPIEINRPRKSRFWMVAPIATTLLAVPASLVLFWLFAISSMAFDSCETPVETSCPEASAALDRAAEFGLLSLLPLILVWTWPRSRRFDWVRWFFAAAYVGVVATSALLIMDVPSGK
ncbi:hypothetical protein [Yinghuangia sp. YIM S09857]|uniref:hypothetical protein n=1 Tax=Yinghuangia sp. YIM S09857 TaxID=3436929 RepID=UPI003F530B83